MSRGRESVTSPGTQRGEPASTAIIMWCAVGAAVAVVALARGSAGAQQAEGGQPGKVVLASVRVNVSDNTAATDNVLPFHQWMNVGDEGGVGIGLMPSTVASPGTGELSDSLPDYLLNNTMTNLDDKQLPWRTKDGWTSHRPPQDVPMAVLENDHLRVEVSALWGGGVHRIFDKVAGKDLVFHNEMHQCVNDGVLRCMVLGGVQFNWSPGQIGHATFNQNPVYAARLATERGDVLRLWEFDRWNATVWQVDLWLEIETLWTYISLINPTNADIAGYWWTDTQMPFTSTTTRCPDEINGHRCRPSPGRPGSRVISPAWGSLGYGKPPDGGAFTLVPWPRFEEGCCGYRQDMPGSHSGRPEAGPLDMSYISNYSGSADAFLQCVGWNRTASPFIVLADEDLWGVEVGVLHGHGTPFNKLFTFAMSEADAWAQTAQGWGGCFVELQIGVAPSQVHTFPLPARATHRHAEYYKLMAGMGDAAASALHSPLYADAVDAAVNYVNSEKGLPPRRWKGANEWLEGVSRRALAPMLRDGTATVLSNGSAWGALHERLSATATADSGVGSDGARAVWAAPTSVVFYDDPVPPAPGALEDVSEWRELLATARFSPETLSRVPGRSFVAGGDPRWLSVIVRSAEASGWTWLHHLHAGVEAAERTDFASAEGHLNASNAMRANAHALRGLAAMVPVALADAPGVGATAAARAGDGFDTAARRKVRLYKDAWEAAVAEPASDPLRRPLLSALAGEMAFVLRAVGAAVTGVPGREELADDVWALLDGMMAAWSKDGLCEDTSACGDQLAVARAQLALLGGRGGGFDGAIDALSSHHFAHYQHGRRPELAGIWLAAQLAKATASKGAPLTAIEAKHVKWDPARAPPVGMASLDRPDFFGPNVTWP